MNFATIKFHDVSNGPGVRVSLYVRGWRNHCKNCFNPETWDFDYGQPFTEEVEKYMARACLMLSKPGGITCFEAIAARLPILAWQPFLKQEQENADFLVRRGMARIVAKEESACLAAISETIYDDEALSSMERSMDEVAATLSRTAACAVVRALAGERRVCA